MTSDSIGFLAWSEMLWRLRKKNLGVYQGKSHIVLGNIQILNVKLLSGRNSQETIEDLFHKNTAILIID